MAPVVAGLALTPVKGTRLREVDAVDLERSGVRVNRRFFLIDDRDRMVNGKHLGELNAVVSEYSDAERRLRLQFPDGQVLEDEVRVGEEIPTRFYSRTARGRVVKGAWSTRLSELVGQAVRLVEADEQGAVDRGARGAVSLISTSSLERLATEGGYGGVDSRRFRMLIEVDGVQAHAEDAWVGRSGRIGDSAVVRFEGHVGRCLVTSRDPITGAIDMPTLDILGGYRNQLVTTEPLPFGVYGRVVEPGRVRVGDELALEG